MAFRAVLGAARRSSTRTPAPPKVSQSPSRARPVRLQQKNIRAFILDSILSIYTQYI